MNVTKTVGRKVKSAARRANKFLPVPFLDEFSAPVVAVSAYRSKNARFVETIIGQLPPQTEFRLHALDDVPPALASRTVSEGRKLRTDALKSLIESSPLPDGVWVVIFDDDATFARSGRSRFLEIAQAGGLDLFGPAINVGQPFSHQHTVVCAGSIARSVDFVEIGPVAAMSPKAVDALLPLPEDFGMGWGLDVVWSQTPELTKGYVDAAPILHHGKVGVSYDNEVETVRLNRILREHGLSSLSDVFGWHECWRPWNRRAPWLASAAK